MSLAGLWRRRVAPADVDISIGTGTDGAIEASDVTLILGDLNGVVTAIRFSRRTMSTVRQNVFWAYALQRARHPDCRGRAYPFLGVLLSPVIASAAMAFSSVSVILNTLRLRGYNPAAA